MRSLRFVRAAILATVAVVLSLAPLSAQGTEVDGSPGSGDLETVISALERDLDSCMDVYSSLDYGPSARCLSSTLTKHADALLPHAEQVIEMMLDEAERPDAHPILDELILVSVGAILSDTSLCKVPTTEYAAACLAAIAQIDDDPLRCEAASDPETALACAAYYIETDPSDARDCRRFGDIGLDTEIGRLTGADMCRGVAARLNDTPDLCREIDNEEVRSACILGSMMPPPDGWTDFGICDEIVGINLNDPDMQHGVTSPEGLREVCGVMAAQAAITSPQALRLCDGLPSPVMRDVCLAGAANKQRDGSYCDHITSAPLRKVCSDMAAGVEDGRTHAAADAYEKELLAALGTYDVPDQVANGHFADVPVCTLLLFEPADCTLLENRVRFELRGDTGDVDVTATIIGELPTGRVGGTSWDTSPDPCPPTTAKATITLTGGFAGIFSRDTARGRAEIAWVIDEPSSPMEGGRCGTRTLFNDEGYWEATLHDGAIDGVVDFGGGVDIPFIADLEAE